MISGYDKRNITLKIVKRETGVLNNKRLFCQCEYIKFHSTIKKEKLNEPLRRYTRLKKMEMCCTTRKKKSYI